MAGSHFSEHCLHQCFFTPNYTLITPNSASGSNDASAKHRMEQKVNGKTDVLVTGLWTMWAGSIF